MAITIVQERKKQRYLIAALAVIIFIILLVVGKGFLGKKTAVLQPPQAPVIYVLPKTEIDWQVLDDIRAQSLQLFEEIGALEGKFGRENPFVPY